MTVEEVAKEITSDYHITASDVLKLIFPLILAEREACAKQLEGAAERYLKLGNDQIAQGLVLQAAAIRERK